MSAPALPETPGFELSLKYMYKYKYKYIYIYTYGCASTVLDHTALLGITREILIEGPLDCGS